MSLLEPTEILDFVFDNILVLFENGDHEKLKYINHILNENNQLEKHIHTKHNSTLLGYCANIGDDPLLKLLIDRGISDLKNVNKNQDSLLHIICEQSDSDWYLKHIPQIFLNIDFNLTNKKGETVLHSASKNISTLIYFNFMLDHKDFNPKEHLKIQDYQGNTCLFHLIKNFRSVELIRCVQLKTDSIYCANNDGKNILDIASEYNQNNICDCLKPLFSKTKSSSDKNENKDFKLFDHVKLKSADRSGIIICLNVNYNFITVIWNNITFLDSKFIENVHKSELEVIQKRDILESGDFIYDAWMLQKGVLIVNARNEKFLVTDVNTEKKLFSAKGIFSEYTTVYGIESVPFEKYFWIA